MFLATSTGDAVRQTPKEHNQGLAGGFMKRIFFTLSYWLGLTRLWAWHTRRQVKILCYHGISGQAHNATRDPHKLHLPVALFQQQLAYLQNHYQIISLHDFVEARRTGRALPQRAVVLTFDDGFRNFRTLAAPLLAARDWPATVFIITGKTRENSDTLTPDQWQPPDDYEHLTWADVRHLTRTGRVEIGSHTHTHPRLTLLSPNEALAELQTAHAVMRSQLGVKAPPLSYPHGLTSPEIKGCVAAAGYSCALSSALGGNDTDADLYDLPRIVIAADDDLATFAARVAGLTWHRQPITPDTAVPLTLDFPRETRERHEKLSQS